MFVADSGCGPEIVGVCVDMVGFVLVCYFFTVVLLFFSMLVMHKPIYRHVFQSGTHHVFVMIHENPGIPGSN